MICTTGAGSNVSGGAVRPRTSRDCPGQPNWPTQRRPGQADIPVAAVPSAGPPGLPANGVQWFEAIDEPVDTNLEMALGTDVGDALVVRSAGARVRVHPHRQHCLTPDALVVDVVVSPDRLAHCRSSDAQIASGAAGFLTWPDAPRDAGLGGSLTPRIRHVHQPREGTQPLPRRALLGEVP